MPPPQLEHDCIGLAELPQAMGRRLGGGQEEEVGEGDSDYDGGLLRETELRLGPPGSELPRRKDKLLALELLPSHKGFASGAKRGFLEAIDGSGKWVFPAGGGGGEGEAGKGATLFSPRGDGAGRQLGGANKDGGPVAAGVAQEKNGQVSAGGSDRGMAPAPKAQVVGWPPIRSYRKNTMAANPAKKGDDAEEKQDSSCLYVKVSMDGAPYLRKIDLKVYSNYKELSSALEKMFSCFTLAGQCGSHGLPRRDGFNENKLIDLHRSEYVLTYEDKDGDWMLVGDVPWEMFTDSCRRLRIMKGSDAIGLAPRSTDKCKNRN